jgi:hypothetical protein
MVSPPQNAGVLATSPGNDNIVLRYLGIEPRRPIMTIDSVRTRQYRLTCRRCHRTWTAAYQVGTFTDDAGDHELYFRGGAPATAPGSSSCPHCGGLRVVVLPSRPR